MVDGLRVFGVGNVIFSGEDLHLLLEPGSLQSLDLRVEVLGDMGLSRDTLIQWDQVRYVRPRLDVIGEPSW
jgi:hypothetical protein